MIKIIRNYNIMNKSIKITNVFLAGIIILVFCLSCNKDDDDNDGWSSCYSCNIDSWKGEFSGTCSYSDLHNNNNDEQNLPITITLDSTGENYFYVSINVVNYYSTNLSGEFIDPSIVNFASSNSSFSSSMYIKDSELKLIGNSKKFHKEMVDTVEVTVIDEVINFETLKIQ